MTLGDKQRLFVRLQGLLIEFAYQNGYEMTEGDGYRDPRVYGNLGEKKGYGGRNSNHKLRLAHDWNVFKDKEWLTKTEHLKLLGEYWESLHDLCEWGGTGTRYDGNHFSLRHNGSW